MCRELTAMGTREPQYNIVAFIMKATVFATPVAEENDTNSTFPKQESTQTNALKQGSSSEQGQETTLTTTPTTLTTTLRLTEAQHEILKIIESFPAVSASELVAKVGNITLDGVKYNLKALQQKGILKRVDLNSVVIGK